MMLWGNALGDMLDGSTFCEAQADSGCETLYSWWVGMITVAVIGTSLVFGYMWATIHPHDTYGLWMKRLAVPWVVESMWRVVFPSKYLQRFAFFNTPLNAILTARCLAFVGEMSWVSQAALGLTHVDRESSENGMGHPLIQLSGFLAVFIYFIAEGISFYNVATTNEWWAGAEVFVDGVAYLAMAPSAIYMIFQRDLGERTSSARLYCVALSVVCLIYPAYNFFIDVPLYVKRYEADMAANKTYFEFIPGLEDAATRKVITHRLADWDQDMTWMTIYFTFGCWTGIALMGAPRVTPIIPVKELNKMLLSKTVSPMPPAICEPCEPCESPSSTIV